MSDAELEQAWINAHYEQTKGGNQGRVIDSIENEMRARGLMKWNPRNMSDTHQPIMADDIKKVKKLEIKCMQSALKRGDVRLVKAIVTLALLSPIGEPK